MKTRYRLIRRGNRGGAFYCVDTQTGKRTSLRVASEDEAHQLIEAKNQSQRQQKAVCTCSGRKLARSHTRAAIRGQKLGAVEVAEMGEVSGYVESASEVSTAEVSRIVKPATF